MHSSDDRGCRNDELGMANGECWLAAEGGNCPWRDTDFDLALEVDGQWLAAEGDNCPWRDTDFDLALGADGWWLAAEGDNCLWHASEGDCCWLAEI